MKGKKYYMKKQTNRFFLISSMVTTTMFVLNKLWISMATSKDVLSSTDDNYYDWRFGKIRYQKKGNGTPLLCIHSLAPGSSLYEFHELQDQLAKNHEIYTLDLLGYGLSDKPSITYTNYLYTELVIDFIQNVIGKKTNIFASNESSNIAIMVCNQEPELISKMVLCNPNRLFEMNEIPSTKTKLLKKIIEMPIIGTFVYHLYMSESIIKKNFIEEYFYNPNRIKQNDMISFIQSSHANSSHGKYTYTSYMGKYMNTNIIHALKSINKSIMILASSEMDNYEEEMKNYTYYNPSIEVEMIDRTKKLMTLESPNKIIHYTQTFF